MRAWSPAPTAVPTSDGGATCESAFLKKPTGKGRQTCRPARSGCPSWLCGVARSSHFMEIARTFPKSCLEGYNPFDDFLSFSSGGRPSSKFVRKGVVMFDLPLYLWNDDSSGLSRAQTCGIAPTCRTSSRRGIRASYLLVAITAVIAAPPPTATASSRSPIMKSGMLWWRLLRT